MRNVQRVCVYCASSRSADPAYAAEARRLGEIMAEAGVTIVYGGSGVGSMRALADAALARGGRVVGVMPRFMVDLEWSHASLTELVLVEDLDERLQRMTEGVDAVIALPGGSGTIDELMQALTWKRLGLFVNPVIIVNQGGYFDPLLQQFDRAVTERFMDERHLSMWSVVPDVEGILDAIHNAPHWSEDARGFAGL